MTDHGGINPAAVTSVGMACLSLFRVRFDELA